MVQNHPEFVKIVALTGPEAPEFDAVPAVAFQCCGDIVDSALLHELCKDCGTVVHLAGPPSVANSFDNPLETMRSHVLGTTALVHAAQRAAVRRFIYVSSAEIYGRASSSPLDEDTIGAPRSPYAAAKFASESVISAAARTSEMEAIIVRPFSVYGPRQRQDGLLGQLITQALSDKPVSLYDLSPCRDYVHVNDLCRALWLAVQLDKLQSRLSIINIATGHGVSVAELAACVLKIVNREGESVIERGCDRVKRADIHHLVGCTHKARQLLGWQHSIQLHQGLLDTIVEYQRTDRVIV